MFYLACNIFTKVFTLCADRVFVYGNGAHILMGIDVARPKIESTKACVLSVRLTDDQERHLKVVEGLLRDATGIDVTRTQVVQRALEIGLAQLESKHRRKKTA